MDKMGKEAGRGYIAKGENCRNCITACVNTSDEFHTRYSRLLAPVLQILWPPLRTPPETPVGAVGTGRRGKGKRGGGGKTEEKMSPCRAMMALMNARMGAAKIKMMAVEGARAMRRAAKTAMGEEAVEGARAMGVAVVTAKREARATEAAGVTAPLTSPTTAAATQRMKRMRPRPTGSFRCGGVGTQARGAGGGQCSHCIPHPELHLQLHLELYRSYFWGYIHDSL